ncbi:MAG: threonine ammonia-lyase [Actinomycetota bacterium]
MQVTLRSIEQAASRIADDVVRTPTLRSRTLSAMTGAEVHVKFENLQFTGSFKDRGSANHLRTLARADASRGVVTLSAGNHAQGVAYHAGRMGIDATIVMPASAPFTKVVNTRALGANVEQFGATFAEAGQRMAELREEKGYHFLPPFNDVAVIAGQGTVALEMLADAPDLDVLLVPIGGGGLIAGMAVAARSIAPSIEIIGVQSMAYPTVARERSTLVEPTGVKETLADGIAVKQPGDLTLPIIDKLVDDVVVVSEESIERAITLYLEVEKTVAEGAGAVALAAVLEQSGRFSGRRVGLVLSGGNIDSRLLASVLMRGLVRTDRVTTLRVTVGDVPGQLAPVVGTIASLGANVVEIDHGRVDPMMARNVNIDIVIETRDSDHRNEVVAALRHESYEVALLD